MNDIDLFGFGLGPGSCRRILGWAAAGWVAGAGWLHGTLSFEKTESHLILWENGRVALVYNDGVVEPAGEGVARNGYIHPLYGLDGDILTDDFPADHLHHRGVFFGWPTMTVMGEQVDIWHLRGLRPSREGVNSIEVTDKQGSFEATNLWRLDDGRAAMREHLRYTIHATSEAGRAIDIHATFTNLTEEPIILAGSPQAAYGGLNVRMDGKRPGVQIATAAGRLEGNANFMDPPSPWAAHSSLADADAGRSGVAIFQHGANPDFPARNWTLRRYGFLGAAWPGESSHSIAPDEGLDLRYRLLIYRGGAEEAKVAEHYAAWAGESGSEE
jgi:hypothetical protein